MYTAVLDILDKLKASVASSNSADSQRYLEEFKNNSETLLQDLDDFIIQQSEQNENFLFWTQFISRHQIVMDLLRADREGLWELHIDAMHRALPEFAAWDSYNYLRNASLYLEDCKRLPETSPTIYSHFIKGSFSIKDKPGKFVAVPGDQKLEQTINRSSKCSDGIIGHSKQKEFIAQWDLIYHEMSGVNNFYREYTCIDENTSESYMHHQSSKFYTKKN